MISLDIYTTLKKPSASNFAIQKTAIASWRRVFPCANIYIYGHKSGMSSITKKFRIQWLKPKTRLQKKDKISDIFKSIHSKNKNNLVLYINSDIILDQNAEKTVNFLSNRAGPWVGSGRRICLPEWQGREIVSAHRLRNRLKKLMPFARWGESYSMDLFIFREISFRGMPEFFCGHCGWDNWIIYDSRMKDIQVIDLSNSINIFHFDHFNCKDSNGQKSYVRNAKYEALNLKKIQSHDRLFHLGHATHYLQNGTIKRRAGISQKTRLLQTLSQKSKILSLVFLLFRKIFFPVWKKIIQAVVEEENWSKKICNY